MTLLQTTTLSDSLFKPQSCWKKMIKENTLVLFCLCFSHLVGVFGDTDTVKSVSVKEGDSVTLQINVTEIQTDDEIEWTFGTNKIVIARINTKTSKIFNGTDGRFRDRLKLDHQTGSLIITDTRTEHTGLYEVEISSSRSEDTTHRFNVTVYGPDGRFRDRLKLDHQTGSLTIKNTRTTHSGDYEVSISNSSLEDTHRLNFTVYDCTFCCHVPEAVTRLVISVLVGMAAAFIVVYDITSRKDEQKRTEPTSSLSDPHR